MPGSKLYLVIILKLILAVNVNGGEQKKEKHINIVNQILTEAGYYET